MASMSTPISQLPTNKPATTSVPDDPEVLNVLKEMDEEVKTATRINQHHAPPPPSPPQHNYHMNIAAHPPPQIVAQTVPKQKQLIDVAIVQKAGIIAVIGLIMFYPGITDTLYALSPKLEILAKFDVFVRTAVFLVVLYIGFTQFKL